MTESEPVQSAADRASDDRLCADIIKLVGNIPRPQALKRLRIALAAVEAVEAAEAAEAAAGSTEPTRVLH